MPFPKFPEDSQSALDKLRAYDNATLGGIGDTFRGAVGGLLPDMQTADQFAARRDAQDWPSRLLGTPAALGASPDSVSAQAKLDAAGVPGAIPLPAPPASGRQSLPAAAPEAPPIISPGGWVPTTETRGSSGISLSPEGKTALKQAGTATENAAKYAREAGAERGDVNTKIVDSQLMQSQADLLKQENINAAGKAREDAAMAMKDQAVSTAANFKPTDYWQEKGVANQIGSAIAMAMGAFGASLNGGPNYAMQIIDGAINRHVAAQEAKQRKLSGLADSARNDVGLAREQTAAEQKAFAYNKIQALEVAKNQWAKMAVGVTNKEALAATEQGIAHLEGEQAKTAIAAAPHFESHTTLVNQPASVAGPNGGQPLSKEEDERYVSVGPDMGGLANSKDQAGSLQVKVNAAKSVVHILDQLDALRGDDVFGKLPLSDKQKKLTSLVNQLGQKYTTAVGGGAAAEHEVGIVNKASGNPDELFSVNVAPALQSMRENVIDDVRVIHEGLRGLNPGFAHPPRALAPRDLFRPKVQKE